MGFTLRGLGPDYDKGVGDRGERVQVMCIGEPTLVIATATGGVNATATRRRMHFVYAITSISRRPARPNLGGSDDYEIEIRFDLHGPHHLNWPGTLYLADGDPADTYDITIRSFRAAREEHWHWLSASIPVPALGPTTRYRVPDWHSVITGSTRTGLTLFENGGLAGAIGTIQTPLAPERNVDIYATNALNVATGWRG